jgi:predicted nuclease of predicted toxin-antitoxin system
MRFLADESCDAAVIVALRDKDHDVAEVGKISPRAQDESVIRMALRQRRILITEDKDFGQLVYASGRPHCGVILLRYQFRARAAIVKSVVRLAGKDEARITGHFIVVQPGHVRIRPDPP